MRFALLLNRSKRNPNPAIYWLALQASACALLVASQSLASNISKDSLRIDRIYDQTPQEGNSSLKGFDLFLQDTGSRKCAPVLPVGSLEKNKNGNAYLLSASKYVPIVCGAPDILKSYLLGVSDIEDTFAKAGGECLDYKSVTICTHAFIVAQSAVNFYTGQKNGREYYVLFGIKAERQTRRGSYPPRDLKITWYQTEIPSQK